MPAGMHVDAATSYCIQSNDRSDNLTSYFNEDTKLQDVTLVCEDSQQIMAHKLMLTARSPFFKEVLTAEKDNRHSFIYFCEFRKSDIEIVLEFLYNGEIKVSDEIMQTFFRLAKLLRIEDINVDPLSCKTTSEKQNEEKPLPDI